MAVLGCHGANSVLFEETLKGSGEAVVGGSAGKTDELLPGLTTSQ